MESHHLTSSLKYVRFSGDVNILGWFRSRVGSDLRVSICTTNSWLLAEIYPDILMIYGYGRVFFVVHSYGAYQRLLPGECLP